LNVLHRTDQVQVKVYNEPEISGDYMIDGAGNISLPLAGQIRAAGLTVPALERTIASRLNRGLIKDPKVNVQISIYAPFFIHGEVKQSGQFPYRPGMTVLDAVASAGGFTYRADERMAYVRPAGAQREHVYPLTAPVPIRPGDNIRIGERLF
jgi:polysaccharide export outer membrane protein